MISLAFLLLSAEPAIASIADAPAEQQIAFIEAAIDQGRLVQAGAMIDRMRQHSEQLRPDPDLIVQEARLALLERRDDEALTAFDAVLVRNPENCTAMEGAGIAAARLGDDDRARRRLQIASTSCPNRWQIWNTIGVLADRSQDWERAESSFQTALRLSPENPEILNNHGYSLLLRKDYSAAVARFEDAHRLAPGNLRIANNLDVARAASGKALGDTAGESSERKATRLNNAGYAALISGDTRTAQAYFTQAVSLSGSYFKRAADNLDLARQGSDVSE
jgi:Flp pilus assembly protein TadD